MAINVDEKRPRQRPFELRLLVDGEDQRAALQTRQDGVPVGVRKREAPVAQPWSPCPLAFPRLRLHIPRAVDDDESRSGVRVRLREPAMRMAGPANASLT